MEDLYVQVGEVEKNYNVVLRKSMCIYQEIYYENYKVKNYFKFVENQCD